MDIKKRESDPAASGDGIAFQEETFCIGELSVVFDILRSKIYSDPIKTICQEISSNARDANREVGNESLPIDITLPSEHDTHLRIRDYGPGISPERMKNVFISYGTTTKKDDYKQTGGLGLGCKSPWSYSDWFEIIVYQKEYDVMMKRLYRAYIDESRVGKLVLKEYHEAGDDVATGTEIVVPIQSDDWNYCSRSILRTCSWWPYIGSPHPNIFERSPFGLNQVNYSCYNDEQHEFVLTGANWAIFKHFDTANVSRSIEMKLSNSTITVYQDNALTAIVDGICYPIDVTALKLSDVKQYNKVMQLRKCPIVLFFDNDEVSPAANREALDYDKQTIDNIRFKLENIIIALEEHFVSIVTNASNIWEAYSNFNEHKRVSTTLGQLAAIESVFPVKYNGVSVQRSFSFPVKTMSIYYDREIGKIDSAYQMKYTVPQSSSKIILCLDDINKNKFSRTRILNIFRNDALCRDEALVVCEHLEDNTTVSRHHVTTGEYAITIDEFKKCNPIVLSTITPIKKKRKKRDRTSVVTAKMSVYQLTTFQGKSRVICGKKEIDLANGCGYYFGKHYSESFLKITEEKKLHEIQSYQIDGILKYLLLTKKCSLPVIAVNKTQWRQLGSGWISLADCIEKELETFLANDVEVFWFKECVAKEDGHYLSCIDNAYHSLGSNGQKKFYSLLQQKNNLHEIVGYFDHLEQVTNRHSWYLDFVCLLSALGKLGDIKKQAKNTKLQLAKLSILAKYPLLIATMAPTFRKDHIKDIAQTLFDYVCLVDKG